MRNRRLQSVDGRIDTAIGKLVRLRDKVCQICGENNPYLLESHHIIPKSKGDIGRMDKKWSILLCRKDHRESPDAAHENPKKFWFWLKEYLTKRGEHDRLKTLEAMRHSPPIKISIDDKKARLKELQAEIEKDKENWMGTEAYQETYKGRIDGEPIYG